MLNKTDEELFLEVYNSCDFPDIKEFNAEKFIEYCEERYKMTTEEFIAKFTKNEYEGNVDMQRWYQYTK